MAGVGNHAMYVLSNINFLFVQASGKSVFGTLSLPVDPTALSWFQGLKSEST